jgi:tRNA-dihydrouridine synthase
MSFSWDQLPKPFLALAPMEGATDTVFRQLVARLAPPDVFFTEFTSVQGMFSRGSEHVVHRLRYSPQERPIIAQIWGSDPDLFERAAAHIEAAGFDGVDINMGCPERSVVKKGMCSGLIRTPDLAVQIIEATQRGVSRIPVSVKTRIGFDRQEIDSWIPALLSTKPAALTVHMRTVKEMSLVPAHWEWMDRIVALRDQISARTTLVGNGDIKTREQAHEYAKKYKIDGVMIGRGIFHDPYVFSDTQSLTQLTRPQKLCLLEAHRALFEQTWANTKNFAILKRFIKIYVSGFADAATLRDELMRTTTMSQLRDRLRREIDAS